MDTLWYTRQMAKSKRLRDEERAANNVNLAKLNIALQNAFELARATLDVVVECNRIREHGDDQAAIKHALLGLAMLAKLSVKVLEEPT